MELVLKQQSSWFEWNSCYLLNRKKERKARRKQKNKGFELWPCNVLTIVIQSSKSVVEINTGEKICFNFLSFPFTSNSKEILLIRASMFLSDYQKNFDEKVPLCLYVLYPEVLFSQQLIMPLIDTFKSPIVICGLIFSNG